MGKNFSEHDKKCMRQALALAKNGIGLANPNPLVGAVIVNSKGIIIGRGYHKRFGYLHAERNAINDCIAQGNSPKNATMYVTLMPCCHVGKQPACTDAIIEAGIKQVVVGSHDPNPLVGKKSLAILQKSGVQVKCGCLKNECDKLNEIFFHYITKHVPYVLMKYAMSADGKIACSNGASRWISNGYARDDAHKLRNKFSSIMVGVGTVIQDNPHLNCRIPNGINPMRIICDTNLRTPVSAKVVQTAHEQPTIIAYSNTEKTMANTIQELENHGCICMEVPLGADEHLDLNALMHTLAQCEIDSVLLEGGATLNAAALQAQIVQELHVYIGTKILGGKTSPSPVGGAGVKKPAQAYRLKNVKYDKFGSNILLKAKIDYSKCK